MACAVAMLAAAHVALGQEVPAVQQVWVDRQFQTDAIGAPVNGWDEGVEIEFYHYAIPPSPNDWRRYIFTTGFVTEANGSKRFATFRYNADYPELHPGEGLLQATAYWPTTMPAANANNRAAAIAVDALGNIYVAGESPDAGQSGADYVVVKYDKELNVGSGGVPTWTYRYDGPSHGDDRPVDLVLTPSGGAVVIVTGTSWNGVNNDIVTIALDSATGQPCGAWPASTGESTGVRRYNGGGSDEAVELAGPQLACGDGGNCGLNCTLEVGVIGTSWGSGTNTLDMLTFKYGDQPLVPAQGVVVWSDRHVAGSGHNEYASGIVFTNLHLVSCGYGPPPENSFTGGGFSASSSGGSTSSLVEPNYDYLFVMYDHVTGAKLFEDRVDFAAAPDVSTDIQWTPGDGQSMRFYVTGRATNGSAFDVGTVRWTWTPGSGGNPATLTRDWVSSYGLVSGRDDRGNALAVDGTNAYATGSTNAAGITTSDTLTIKHLPSPASPAYPPTWYILYAGGGDDLGRDIVTGNQHLTKPSVYFTGRSFRSGQGNDYITIRLKQN
ncbi:MAG: hypothetical protein ACKVU4_09210 [Phycisphaerales bacterium]